MLEHKEVCLRFYESVEGGKLELAVEFPDDMDEDNLRPFEEAAIVVLSYIKEQSEEWHSINEN